MAHGGIWWRGGGHQRAAWRISGTWHESVQRAWRQLEHRATRASKSTNAISRIFLRHGIATLPSGSTHASASAPARDALTACFLPAADVFVFCAFFCAASHYGDVARTASSTSSCLYSAHDTLLASLSAAAAWRNGMNNRRRGGGDMEQK